MRRHCTKLSKALLRGNAYAFKELGDRAFGKLKETHQVDVSPYKDVPAEDLTKEIKRLEVQLGYAKPEEPSQRQCFRQSGIEAKLFCGRRIPNPVCRFKQRVIGCLYAGMRKV